MKAIRIFQILFIFFISLPANSELKNISLKECIEIAIQNHPEIKASDEDNLTAQSNYTLAKAKNKPVINFEMRTIGDIQDNQAINSLDSVNILNKDTMVGIFAGPSAVFNLYDAQISALTDSARISIDLAKMQSIKIKYDIIFNVKKCYYEYLFAKDNRKKREELVEKSQLKLDQAKKMGKLGQRTSLDETKAEVDLAGAKLEFEKAKNYENTTKIDLLLSMDIIEEDIEFTPVKVDQLPELRFPLKKLYELADQNNPELRSARILREINRLNIDVARSEHFPVVDLIGAAGISNAKIFNLWDNDLIKPEEMKERLKYDNWDKTFYLAITAKVNLWSGGAINARVDSKAADYNKSKYYEREISNKIKAMIRNYFQSISEYKNQVELSDVVLKNSQKHLTFAKKSYENGSSTRLDLQDAELTLLNSELGFLKSRYDYLIILAKLANTVGLDEEYICVK